MVDSLIRKDQDLEINPLLHWQPMQFNKIIRNQLYTDSKTDFSSSRKCLMVLQCFRVLSKEFQEEGPQNCTIRKHFLCYIDTIILGISCWVIVCLNMFSKIR